MIVSAWTSSILGHFKNQPQTCVLDSPSLDGAGFAGQVDMMPMIKDTVEDYLPLTFFGGKRGGGLGLGNWAPGKRQPSNQPRGVLFQAQRAGGVRVRSKVCFRVQPGSWGGGWDQGFGAQGFAQKAGPLRTRQQAMQM